MQPEFEAQWCDRSKPQLRIPVTPPRGRQAWPSSAAGRLASSSAAAETGDRLLPSFHHRLSNYAEELLRRRGVDVRLATTVQAVDQDGVVLESGERIPAATVVWAGGVAAPAWLRESGLPLDHGRLVVDDDLRLPGHPNAFAIGDVAAVPAAPHKLYPQVAQVALQGGRHAARQMRYLAAGEPTRLFHYWDKGSMAVIGCNSAIVETGHFASPAARPGSPGGLLHLAYLRGMPNRLSVAQKWRWWHVTHEATARVLVEQSEAARGPGAASRDQPGGRHAESDEDVSTRGQES